MTHSSINKLNKDTAIKDTLVKKKANGYNTRKTTETFETSHRGYSRPEDVTVDCS